MISQAPMVREPTRLDRLRLSVAHWLLEVITALVPGQTMDGTVVLIGIHRMNRELDALEKARGAAAGGGA